MRANDLGERGQEVRRSQRGGEVALPALIARPSHREGEDVLTQRNAVGKPAGEGSFHDGTLPSASRTTHPTGFWPIILAACGGAVRVLAIG